LKEGNASIHANNLAFDPLDSQGINVGNNSGDRSILPLGGVALKAGKTASKGIGDDVLSMNK